MYQTLALRKSFNFLDRLTVAAYQVTKMMNEVIDAWERHVPGSFGQ